MAASTLTRRITLLVGGAAIIGMGTLSACSSTTKEEAPSTSKSSTAPSSGSSAPAAPNEKGMSPNSPNSFSPSVKAPPAPTAEPG